MLNNDWKNIVDGGRGEEFTSIDNMKQYKIQVNL